MIGKVRALVLLSGGLDSMLAAKVLMEQGVEVVGLSFISNFFNAERAFEATKQLGIPLIAYNFADEHLAMVKNPPHGHGKNMNPCIDCHGMMVARAKEIMEGKEVVLIYPDSSLKVSAEPFDFVATGEVLGQRPMSQNARALKVVAGISGIGDKLVRPLSAKLLDETEPEKTGKIDREALHSINGRSRAPQTALAEKLGIKEYPSPGGGCILTMSEFSNRLRELFANWPDATSNDVQLIKNGRNIWLDLNGEKVLLVIGRDEKESMNLEKIAKQGGQLLNLVDVMGPTALIRGKTQAASRRVGAVEVHVPRELDIETVRKEFEKFDDLADVAALLVGYYSTKARGQHVKVQFVTN